MNEPTFTCPKCKRVLPGVFYVEGAERCIECRNAALNAPQQPSLEEVPRKRRPNIHDD